MARIRSIKPEFFKHHDLYTAEVESGLPLRIAFAGLWTCADVEGRFKWKPPQLKLDVLPYDTVDFKKVLESLEKNGFIKKYSVGNEDFAFIPTFKDHQRITGSEATSESRIPSPPTSCKKKKGNNKETTTETHEANEGNNKDHREGKGREGKGKELGREPDHEFIFKLQKIYDYTWDEYNGILEGQKNKVSEFVFLKWKEFVDFVNENNYLDLYRCKFVSPFDFGILLTQKKFFQEKWKDVIERILAVGVTPQQNLFFRIPQFIEYVENNKNGKTGKQSVADKQQTGFDALLAKGQQQFNAVREKNNST